MPTDRYEEFRAKAIISKQMFVDLVNKTDSGFKMYQVKALGDESYLCRLLVEGNCFDLPEDEARDIVQKTYDCFSFNITLLNKESEILRDSYNDPLRIEVLSGEVGIDRSLFTRNLSFLNLEDAMEYLNWEKNDPARIQAREDEKKNGIVYSLLRLY